MANECPVSAPYNVVDYLTSLFAIYAVPCCLLSIPRTLVFQESNQSEPPDLLSPPSRRSPFLSSSSLFYHMFLKNNLDIPFERLPMPTNATFYHQFPGNRLLELTSPPVSTPQKFIGKRITKSSIRKSECMFRAHWNKRYPLGKSNMLHTAQNPSELGSDCLWELKLACNHKLAIVVESVLGCFCPAPPLDHIRSMPDLSVLRECEVIPRLSVCPRMVTQVVLRIAKQVFPTELWERRKFLLGKIVTKYINLNRFESLKTSKLDHFLVGKFFVPLISYLFYVTEASDDTVHYFRRPVWDLITTKASRGFVELLELRRAAAAEAVALKVRWIPKKSGGLRPIVVLPKLVREKSKRLLRYLTALRVAKPELLGSSVLSRDDSFSKFEKFLSKNKSPIRFFTADIQNCFESIPFGGLEQCLKSLTADSTLFDSAMVSSVKRGGPLFPRKRPIVFLRGDLDNLLAQVPSSADAQRPVIVRAEISSFSNERMDFGALRKEIVRIIRGTVYRLTTEGSTTRITPYVVSSHGLPQGNSLSVLLVSLYYGWLDSRLVCESTETLLLRLVDDILCVSTNDSEFDTLYHQIVSSNAYGQINAAKLQTNTNWFTWAGFVFKPSKFFLNVSPEPSPFTTHKNPPRSVFHYFKNSLGRSLAQQCLRGFYCPRINTTQTRNENAYRAGAFAGTRIRQLKTRGDHFPSKFAQFMRRRFKEDETLLRSFFMGLRDSL